MAKEVTGVNQCGPDPPGANVVEKLQDVLAKFSDRLETETKPDSVLTFSEIQTNIDAGLPVCARITWFGEFGAHFAVIYGWGQSASGDQWVDVGDPFFGTLTILYDNFVHNYLDAGQWTDTFLLKRKP
jgi:hypothetical protein